MNGRKILGVVAGTAVAGAVAALLVSVGPKVGSAGDRPIRKIVLVTIDTLRADRLGCYGYSRPTSPNLDAFAQEGVLFEKALVPAPWTAPSMAAMITGRYPFETGVYTNQNQLGKGLSSLAATLGKAGLATAWFNTNPVLMLGSTQFRDGFQHVEPAGRIAAKVPYSQIEPSVLEWLDEQAQGDFFLWIHNMDPHSPPTEGNPYHEDKSWHVYDAEIRLVDDAMGSLFAKLKALGIWDETLVIFTADHGEAFSEHMLPGHQNVIYDEVLHVPMIVRFPGAKTGLRVAEPVELIDIYKTIADLAQVPVPQGVRGESLVPLLEGTATERQHEYSFHSRYYVTPLNLHYFAVRDREYKLIARVPFDSEAGRRMIQEAPEWTLDRPGTTLELYNYAEDPGEQRNLIFFGADPKVAKRLEKQLLEWRDRVGGHGSGETQSSGVELDEKTRETLRKLGYDGD
jgi:arylsulfatase A-like enzyme